MEKKILLIEPPFYRLYKPTYSLNMYPLSLGYLSGTIKDKTDWEVMSYNADFSCENEKLSVPYLSGAGFYKYLDNLKDPHAKIWGEVKKAIDEYKPTVVGITAKSQNFKSACMVARLVKEYGRQTTVIMGGAHPSMVGRDVLACPDIDICVRGEGENTVVELLNAVSAGGELGGINGIIYRKNGQICENPAREYIHDLDSLCFPNDNAPFLLKDYSKYPKSAFKNIFATRGCPNDCFFCGSRNIWSRKVRFRSVANVVKEVKNLMNAGLGSVSFADDFFGVTKKNIFELCNAIETGCPGIKWDCEIHVKLIDEETIRVMKRSGCYSIRIGIESGNNDLLKQIHKNITIEEALAACKIIKKNGLELHVFYMIGFPQETENTLMDTFRAMKNTPCDTIIYSIFTPYPGTEAFELCKKLGLIGNDYDLSLYNHQSPLNYFCPSISKERFRVIAGKIERMVEKKYILSRIRRVFSLNTIWRIKEAGAGRLFKKALGIK